jgi:membrane-bound lytic murein transglycosylase B
MHALMLVSVLAAIDGGVTETADAGLTAGWKLSLKLGKGLPARAELIQELTRPSGGVGEAALSPEDAEALLDDPRAELIYGDKTVSIVAPSMVSRHRQEHIDLMNRFLQPERVDAGKAFMKEREASLAATEKRSGVDREVIIGILMWESKLGTITGSYFAFNALASQAYFVDEANALALSQTNEKSMLSSAKQSQRVETIRNRARRNLVALVRQCKGRGIDPLSMKGSWAGALGFPQFMPASLRWAEDGNGDGKIDLFDMDDAIASVGKYLSSAGFKKNPKQAVYNYNHEQAYVDGVLAFADALRPKSDAGVKAPEIK